MYTTYLFDFDYTLADSSAGIVMCFQKTLLKNGFENITDDDVKRTIGKTLEDSFSILTGITNIKELEKLKSEYIEEAKVHMTENTFLFSDTLATLTYIKKQGARIGIISTKYRYNIEDFIQHHFPNNFFDIIIGGEDIKEHKPSAEGILMALDKLKVNTDEILYIGDSIVDAETAQNANVDFCGITTGVTLHSELENYPHKKIINSLSELTCNNDAIKIKNKKKYINIWQILILLLLMFIIIDDLNQNSFNLFFTVILIWTLFTIITNRRILPNKAYNYIDNVIKPYVVRFHATHINVIRGREAITLKKVEIRCLNCGTVYEGNYCIRCGQNSHTARFQISNAFRNILGGFTNIDNGFGRTVTELIYRPGHMIRDYINGKRIIYFRPFQTLFILAAIYIIVVQFIDPNALKRDDENVKIVQNEDLFVTRTQIQKEFESSDNVETKIALTNILDSIDKQILNKSKSNYNINNKNSIGQVVVSGKSLYSKVSKMVHDSPFLQRVWTLLKNWGEHNKAFQIISILPFFTLASLLMFRKMPNETRYNVTEHLFIQTYIACQVLFISILILPFNGHATMEDLYEIPISAIFILYCIDFKQLYRCSWRKSVISTSLMFLMSIVTVILFAIMVVLLILAIGTII